MRLHELSVTAFGPFAGTERVDFDELNDAGLFLLTGPTGAGKTSILDAVCFALYGSVPGVRGVKALKSQHAGLETAPEVVLDFAIRDRRFVVRRSPEWVRPKRKGSGFITEKASATLVETTGGSDHFLSSRAQEVGHLIGELVGMSAAQFVQVAMLPQGDFQKFLRASSDERHGVLQHLFKTDRFTKIEDWVNEHSRDLRDQAGHGERTVVRILDSVADRASVELPDELSAEELPAAASDGRLLAWTDAVLSEAAAALAVAGAAHDQASAALADARARHEAGQRLAAAFTRREAATRTLQSLAEADADEAAARAALEADARAASCLPVLRLLDDARARLQDVGADREAALAALLQVRAPGTEVPPPADPTTEALTALTERLRSRVTRVEGLLPRARERREAQEARDQARGAVADARAELERLETRRDTLPGRLTAVRERLDDRTATAARREAIGLALETARSRLDAAETLPGLERELVALQDAARDARDQVACAREHVQDLADRRLAGIAAELAGRLEDGRPCQVCGSPEHPVPARPGGDVVTEAEQQQANADYDTRTEQYAEAARRVAEAERRLDTLRQAAQGLDAAAAREQVLGLERGRADADRAAADRQGLEAEIAELVAEQDRVGRRLAELGSSVAVLDQSLVEHERTIARVTEEIAAVTGDADAPLEQQLGTLREMLDAATRAAAAVAASDTAGARVTELAGQAARIATEQGFDDADAGRAAALQPPERDRCEALLAERAETAARARAVLDDPEVRSAGEQPEPDLDRLVTALRGAERADAEAARSHHQGDQVVGALRQHLERLRTALDDWAPVRERYARADAMSKLVRGMGHDNQLQMRLSAYVLATRLDQVVAAANERLAHMRDQRYLLQRTGRAARKGAQAGLGLEMVDQWTGDVRDPATLSGGETFVVSLSLALGLADVVTQEAGGTEIETLFVDEGFGTLDADTLDDVMDRLDGLRAGGRTVGVVSHVSELRNRIPTQVHVHKHRTGSTVAVRTLAG